MFTANDVLKRVKLQPFLPLRVVATTGQGYEVHHPDLVMVGRHALMIGHATPDNPSVFDQVAPVAMIHVTELQEIVSAPPPKSSGMN